MIASAMRAIEKHLLGVDYSRFIADPGERRQYVDARAAQLARVCGLVGAEDWDKLFPLLGHPQRGAALVLFADRMEPATLNRVLAEWWNATEGVRPREAVPIFRRAGYVTDDPDAALPSRDLTVYRGVRISRHRLGLSWTLDIERARFFAGRFTSGGGYVYRAIVPPAGVLAYFTSRGEQEVVVDPAALQQIARVLPCRTPSPPREREPAASGQPRSRT